MSYERIDPIERSPGVDPMTRVVPLHRVGSRENPAEDDEQRRRREQQRQEREQPEDDGRPHVDVLV